LSSSLVPPFLSGHEVADLDAQFSSLSGAWYIGQLVERFEDPLLADVESHGS
jgi:hypothetical protein